MILITGGDGYLGQRLAEIYLQDFDVFLWVRAASEEEFRRKVQWLCHRFPDRQKRMRVVGGDLRKGDPFRDIDAACIEFIVHAAAVTRFNVDRETALAVNLEGSKKLLQFARKCRKLKALGFLSTIYSSGLKAGNIMEVPFDGAEGFSNYYEWSKCGAEIELLTGYSDLPWRLFRVATVIADNEQGSVTQYNAFHNTLKLLYYGLMSLLPGRPETPLYFVTGEFVSGSIFQLMQEGPFQTIFHVSHTRDESATLGQLIDEVYETFQQKEDFRKKRILKPLYSDEQSFTLLVDAVTKFAGGVVNQAVSSVAPFSRQLYINKVVSNQNLRTWLKNYHAPDPFQLIRNTCHYLMETKWGRKEES